MNFIRKNIYGIGFAIIGGIGGFLYWKFVGCQSGACPLKSIWYYNTFLGSLIGYFLGDTLKDYINKSKKKTLEKENGENSN